MFYKHGMCFAAVAVITQLKFENGELLFEQHLEGNGIYSSSSSSSSLV